MTTFVPPSFGKPAYICPHCGAYAQQVHYEIRLSDLEDGYLRASEVGGALWTECAACDRPSLWLDERLVYPANSSAPTPHSDFPPQLLPLYEEASDIAGRSPSGAAALLRLLLEKLCRQLTGDENSSLDDNIHALVEQQRLPIEIERALHTIRVIGNNAVHPGEIDLNDEKDLAASLFMLVNTIVAEAIARPKRIEEIFGRLPEGARQGIEKKKQRRASKSSTAEISTPGSHTFLHIN